MRAVVAGGGGRFLWAFLALICGFLGGQRAGWAQQEEGKEGELNELCTLSAPESSSPAQDEQERYHRQRRRLVHQVHEVEIRGIDESFLDYDRVTGLLTINGFRAFVLGGQSPEIGLRNQCVVGFEVEEQEALDLMAQLALGAVRLEVGFLLAAHDDYEAEFCVSTDGGWPRLMVDLLYARLRTMEGEVLSAFQTPLGHRLALRQSALVVGAAAKAMPQVQVSHFQWRQRGLDWSESFREEALPAELMELQGRVTADIERGIYPCYVRALSRNASLQGAMVVEVVLGEEGGERARFLMNTLGDEQVDECVQGQLQELAGFNVLREVGEVDGFKATLLMRRVEHD